VERSGGKGVGGIVRRLSPTVIAAIALAVLLLTIVGAMLLRGGGVEDDRLTNAVTAAREDPEKLCSSQATYDLIKRDLFRRAAALRGNDQATLNRLGSYSSLRVEAPLLQQQNENLGSVTCNATITLDLPPGVVVVGGRRSLSADVLYTVQPAADGSGSVLTLANADGIITALATLSRTEQPAEDNLNETNAVVTVPGEITPIDPLAPAPAPGQVAPAQPTANPSFDCGNARTSGEAAVCSDPRLAALDRRMAAQFRSALADASPQQRAILNQTRDSFLRYRDQCPSSSCVAETYQGRMREIRDIMRGNWQPRR
jgi:uncharacterized protein YecT (DUF1311 family)